MSYCLTHCHSATGSNVCILDSISKPRDIVNRAVEIGLSGVCVTDHGTISAAVEMIKQRDALKDKGIDFRILFGCEIYLIDESDDANREGYKTEWEYYHCILIAKDEIGWQQLKLLTSKAWERSYFFKGIRRVPVYYGDIEALEEKGHLICQSACLGGAIPKALLQNDKAKANSLVNWFLNQFGKDFYFEIQPNDHSPEQIQVNRWLIDASRKSGIPYVITTDAHYLCKEDKPIHAAYLNSRDSKGNRETEPFYDYTYIMEEPEIYQVMNNMGVTDEEVKVGLDNTMTIMASVENFDFRQKTIIPQCPLPEFKVRNLFSDYYEKYPFIKDFAFSFEPQDRFMVYTVESGLLKKKMPITDEIANRLNIEFEVLRGLSDYHKQPMSAYLNLVKDMIDVMWQLSPVMPGRGSCTGFLTCFLMEITQINPLTYKLPWFRFLNLGRVDDFPDIDCDFSNFKASQVIELLRERYGQDCVLNTLTFKTETLKAAILSASRGLGINDDEAHELSALVPLKRGKMPSLEGCINGDEEIGTDPVPELIERLKSHKGLYEAVEKIQGICAGIGIHASSLYVFSKGYLAQNALMRAPNGVLITAFNMHDSDDMGALKMDLLKTLPPALFSKCMSYMLRDKVIEYKGSLRSTWDSYFHPDVIEYENPQMWENASNGKVLQLFQFGDSQVGSNTIRKVRPKSVVDMALANDVMRLQGTYDGETPTDRFVRYKEHPDQAISEMKQYGLDDREIALLERHLGESYFVSVEQEQLMMLLLDEEICGMPLRDVNVARKILAKKQMSKLPKLKSDFFRLGAEKGNREVFLNWTWTYALLPQLAYSFSKNHSVAYSTIGAIEAWLVTKYNPLYWDCAVLSVQAGGSAEDDETIEDFLDEEEFSKEEEFEGEDGDSKTVVTNYGKIGRGIALVQSHGITVAPPDINLAEADFFPDVKRNVIVYGLQAITSSNEELVNKIISNRPYKSIEDFLNKVAVTNIQMINLIKAGAFDSLYPGKHRKYIMATYLMDYAKTKVSLKEKLTMANYLKALQQGIVPNKFDLARRCVAYKSWIDSNEVDSSTKRYLIKNADSKKFFETYLIHLLKLGKQYDTIPGGYAVKVSSMKTAIDANLVELKQWLTSPEAVTSFYEGELNKCISEQTAKYCDGSVSKWEMDSVHYYSDKHELSSINKTKYSIKNFDKLSELPEVIGKTLGKDGKEYPVFDLCNIAGTVLNSDNNKHIVSLLTVDGTVVDVKFYKGSYIEHNKVVSRLLDNGKKEVVEKSWFSRGSLIMVSGFRRENSFVPKRDWKNGFPCEVQLITAIRDNGDIVTKREREKV